MAPPEPVAPCLQCPEPPTTGKPNFLSTARHAETVAAFLNSSLGSFTCTACQLTQDAWLPLLYDDPDHGIIIYATTTDHEDLDEEYHAFVNRIRDELPPDTFRRATEEEYQIVTGLTGVREVARAAINGVYIYTSAPGLSDAPMFDIARLLEVALHYRRAERFEEAYAVLERASVFPTSDASFWRELGATALTAGQAAAARSAFAKALELESLRHHVTVTRTPGQGIVSKPPPGVTLPIFHKTAKNRNERQRPELHMPETETARLAGLIIGEIERACIEVVGPRENLPIYHVVGLDQFDRWAAEDERECAEAELRRVFQATRSQARGYADLTGLPPETLLALGRTLIDTDLGDVGENALRMAWDSASGEVTLEAALQLGIATAPRDPGEAESFFRQAATSASQTRAARALLGLAQIALARGQRQAARDLLNETVDIGDATASPQALFTLASLEHEDGNLVEEEKCLISLVRQDYGNVTARAALALGVLLVDRNELDAAERVFMLADNSTDFETKLQSSFHVGALRAARGDKAGARALLSQVAAFTMVKADSTLGRLAAGAERLLEMLDAEDRD